MQQYSLALAEELSIWWCVCKNVSSEIPQSPEKHPVTSCLLRQTSTIKGSATAESYNQVEFIILVIYLETIVNLVKLVSVEIKANGCWEKLHNRQWCRVNRLQTSHTHHCGPLSVNGLYRDMFKELKGGIIIPDLKKRTWCVKLSVNKPSQSVCLFVCGCVAVSVNNPQAPRDWQP